MTPTQGPSPRACTFALCRLGGNQYNYVLNDVYPGAKNPATMGQGVSIIPSDTYYSLGETGAQKLTNLKNSASQGWWIFQAASFVSGGTGSIKSRTLMIKCME